MKGGISKLFETPTRNSQPAIAGETWIKIAS